MQPVPLPLRGARLIICPATEADRRFIVSAWLDSFRDATTAGMIHMDDWYAVMWPQVVRLLDREGCTTLVACEPDDSMLYGFICGEVDISRPRSRRQRPPVVNYCYVKTPYRRWAKPGIARRLFGAIGIDPQTQFDYTYKTAVVSQLAHKIPLASHQPMLARFNPGKGYRR